MTSKREDLFASVRSGTPQLVRALIMTGADIDEKSDGGETVLTVAVRNGRTEILDVLLELGADITEKEPKNGLNLLEWLLFICSKKRYTELTDKALSSALWLIKNGLDIGENQITIQIRQDSPDIYKQITGIIVSLHKFTEEDIKQSVCTEYNFDL